MSNQINPLEISLFVFRRDLRIEDNCALFYALKDDLPVLTIFIIDDHLIDSFNPRRKFYLYTKLKQIHQKLQQCNSSLWVIKSNTTEALNLISQNYTIKKIFVNSCYEPHYVLQEEEIKLWAGKHKATFFQFKNDVIFEKNEIIKKNYEPYTVFTPYSIQWKKQLTNDLLKPYESEKLVDNLLKINIQFPSEEELNFKTEKFNIPAEQIDENVIKNYHLTRDIPSISGTSRLSVHINFGAISIRYLVRKAIELNHHWLNELIWREFFTQLLWHYPRLVNESFKKQYDFVSWRNDEAEFTRWCEAQTGFPLIDAAMTELITTGFMHNRVRMVVANFLTKILHIDWRWGEAFFSEHLFDYDLALNNGNWQWAAGCGADAAPYFRIFNPTTQIQKFDKNLEYIKQYIPQYNENNYIYPMVNFEERRKQYLALHKK